LRYVGHLFDGDKTALNLAAVRYLVVDRELVALPASTNRVTSAPRPVVPEEVRAFVRATAMPVIAVDDTIAVLENTDSFRRAYVARQAVPASSGSAAVAAVVASSAHWDDRAAIEGVSRGGSQESAPSPPGSAAIPSLRSGQALAAPGRSGQDGRAPRGESQAVVVADLSPDRVRVTVPAGPGGFLVLADAYHPGWQASVDGVATPVLPANGMFRAVSLPPNARQVEFTFVPAPLRLGACISVVTLLLVGLIPILGPAKDRWRRARRMTEGMSVQSNGARLNRRLT
jgi:hypothetical protein